MALSETYSLVLVGKATGGVDVAKKCKLVGDAVPSVGAFGPG